MRSVRILLRGFFAVFVVLGVSAHAQDEGVTSEPDIHLRAEQNTSAPVVATVKRDNPFSYECEAKAEWCKVRVDHDLGRLYQITATIKPDGKATVVWKLKDR